MNAVKPHDRRSEVANLLRRHASRVRAGSPQTSLDDFVDRQALHAAGIRVAAELPARGGRKS